MSGPQSAFSGIFAPGGRMMTEALPPGEEGILYADCDLEAQVGPKLRHDVVGQYQRPDVVALLLDREPRSPLVEVGGEVESRTPDHAPEVQPGHEHQGHAHPEHDNGHSGAARAAADAARGTGEAR